VPTCRAYNSIALAASLGAALLLSSPLAASTGEMLLEGCRLLQGGEYTQAADTFAAITQQDAFCESALVGLGLARLRQGELLTALDNFHRASTLGSASSLPHLALGAAYCQRHDYAAARSAYEHLLSLDLPERDEIAAALAYLDCMLGLYDSARVRAVPVLESTPPNPLARYALTASLYVQNRLSEAITIIEGPAIALDAASTWVDCCLFSPAARYAQEHELPVVVAALPPTPPSASEYLHQEPDFSITYPQHMQTITGKIHARLRVKGTAGVEYIALLLGDRFVGITNVEPFAVLVDSTICPDGVQRLRVNGYSKAGQIVRKASIGVIVQNGNRTLTTQERTCRRIASSFLRHQLRVRPRPGQWEHLCGRIWEAAGQSQRAWDSYETAFNYSPTLPRLREHLLALGMKMNIPVLRSPTEIHQLLPGSAAVALTFDDGPHPQITPWLLDQLDRFGVKATFFLVGKQVDLYPQLTREILRRGHQLASHSYTHRNLRECSPLEVERELVASRAAMWRGTGVNVPLFRPPGGHYDEMVRAAAATWGFTTVFWTANISNYPGAATQQVLTGLLRDITPQGIILLHNGEDPTIDILPSLLSRLTAKKMPMVTITTASSGLPPAEVAQ